MVTRETSVGVVVDAPAFRVTAKYENPGVVAA